ncbi:MAG TPA: hypothetical protein VGQ21_16775 [Thermoanaerobaculia bacterium]|jgi:hypothetical protein|nr:hypothetical protein [Thermoanaerobaculia bacterium]
MKRALTAILVLVEVCIVIYLGGGVLPAAVFFAFVATFLLPACALMMRLPALRAMPGDLRLSAAAVLVVILAAPWFFARKALPFPPAILDVVLCLILSVAALKFGRLAATINELRPVLIRSRFVAAVLPVLFALVWLGYAVPANGQVLFHGLFAIDFGNLVSVVATLRASPSLPLAAIADGGWINYHWLYFTLPAALVDFCDAQVPAFNALILTNVLMAMLLVHTLMTLISTLYPRTERTTQWTVAVVLFAPFTGYYYQIAASRLSLGCFAMPVRNHLVLSPLNSMIVFGNNTFALVLALFTAMMLARWNGERRLADIVLGTFALSMVTGYSATLLVPLVVALILWLLLGRIERPAVALTAALVIGGIVTAMFVAIHVLGGGAARHAVLAFDSGQFFRIVFFGMLPLCWLAWMGGRKRLTFFHVLIAAAIAVPSVLYVAGSPTGQVDVSMKTGSLLAVAFAPLVAFAIDKWLSGETGRAQSAVAALLIVLGLVQTAAYVLQFPYYRITNSRARSLAFPLDYYEALVWIRDHTTARSIVVDPGGLNFRDEIPTLWIGERRGWLPTPNTEAFLSPGHSDISRRAAIWADFIRDPASTAGGVISRQADYLMIPRAIQSPFWVPVGRTGSWWIYRSVRSRPGQS